MKLSRNAKNAQSIIEFSTLVILVVAGIVLMRPYLLRAINAQFKSLEDGAEESVRGPIVEADYQIQNYPAICGNRILETGEEKGGPNECCQDFDQAGACGDGVCCSATGEDDRTSSPPTGTFCAADCCGTVTPGDGVCDRLCGETRDTDPAACWKCQDGFCDRAAGEDFCSCGPTNNDCFCTPGDTTCDLCIGENPGNCPSQCNQCGNGICEAEYAENMMTCPADCHGYCGDGFCDTKQFCLSENGPCVSRGENECSDENPNCNSYTIGPSCGGSGFNTAMIWKDCYGATCQIYSGYCCPDCGACGDGQCCTYLVHPVSGYCSYSCSEECSTDHCQCPATPSIYMENADDVCDTNIACSARAPTACCSTKSGCTLCTTAVDDMGKKLACVDWADIGGWFDEGTQLYGPDGFTGCREVICKGSGRACTLNDECCNDAFIPAGDKTSCIKPDKDIPNNEYGTVQGTCGSMTWVNGERTCGNWTCDAGEDCSNCELDCYGDPAVVGGDGGGNFCWCGNGVCDLNENCATCPDDCQGLCDKPDDCCTCPEQCGVDGHPDGFPCYPNDHCDCGETQETNPHDCCGYCGDGICNTQCFMSDANTECPVESYPFGLGCQGQETPENCPQGEVIQNWGFGMVEYGDCSPGATCPDGTCDPWENSNNCLADCPVGCPNGFCDAGETCVSTAFPGQASDCLDDCGTCENNGHCDTLDGEDPSDPAFFNDCGCGNGICNKEIGEDIDTNPNYCLEDCHCGDGIQQAEENCATCPEDVVGCPIDGDGVCTQGETACGLTSADCGPCCGQRGCESGETCSNCCTDCCPSQCGGGGGGTCFLAGTMITMADGSEKPIEEVKIGEYVLSYDPKTKTFKNDKVTDAIKHNNAKGYLIINGHLKVTPNHAVFSQGQWVLAGRLKVGDMVLNQKGEKEPVISIVYKNESVTAYNFEVNPFHVYIADGFVVHNASDGSGKTVPSPNTSSW